MSLFKHCVVVPLLYTLTLNVFYDLHFYYLICVWVVQSTRVLVKPQARCSPQSQSHLKPVPWCEVMRQNVLFYSGCLTGRCHSAKLTLNGSGFFWMLTQVLKRHLKQNQNSCLVEFKINKTATCTINCPIWLQTPTDTFTPTMLCIMGIIVSIRFILAILFKNVLFFVFFFSDTVLLLFLVLNLQYYLTTVYATWS